MGHQRTRLILLVVWLAVVTATLYGFLFHREDLQSHLASATDLSAVAGATAYLALGCARGFSLVPVTSLVLLGLPFFPPVTLFLLTLAGILVSSTCIYRFTEALHLDELIRRRHGRVLGRLQASLERHGLPIIAGWSFFPLAPTDAVCYLSGVLKIGLGTCLLGVGLGEGAICGIYIFLGDQLLRWLHFK